MRIDAIYSVALVLATAPLWSILLSTELMIPAAGFLILPVGFQWIASIEHPLIYQRLSCLHSWLLRDGGFFWLLDLGICHVFVSVVAGLIIHSASEVSPDCLLSGERVSLLACLPNWLVAEGTIGDQISDVRHSISLHLLFPEKRMLLDHMEMWLIVIASLLFVVPLGSVVNRLLFTRDAESEQGYLTCRNLCVTAASWKARAAVAYACVLGAVQTLFMTVLAVSAIASLVTPET